MRWRVAVVFCLVVFISGCADPRFVHDPQIGFFDKTQLPPLLKSLRCELATYIAANNQRKIINVGLYDTNPIRADNEFPFFQIDPSRFGGFSLELKIQDSLGTQSGTTADWKRTIDPLHTRVWHIAPTAGEQNSYDLVAAFLLPQDIYGLHESDGNERKNDALDRVVTRPDLPYLCYKNIPREPGKLFKTDIYNEIFTEQNLVDVARGLSGEPQFDRVRVNADLPLAAWLLDVGTTMSTTSLNALPGKDNEQIIPGQVSYVFTIQTNVGLDVRNTISTSLWTSLGAEASGGFQHTGTLTLVLNGLDAVTTSGVKSGNTSRIFSRPIKPTTVSVAQYCPLPKIGAKPGPGYQIGEYCLWPQREPARQIAAAQPKKPKSESGVARPAEVPLEGVLPTQPIPRPTPSPTPLPRLAPAPAARPFLNRPHGTIEYPESLSPLGR
jgi:hypothetical protein